MSGIDLIWTALGILMVVCICIDSGLTIFSGIQAIQLGEAILLIAFPGWIIWSFIFALNLPLEIACIVSTRRYLTARILMAVHANLKLIILFRIAERGDLFWVTHYLNQGILVVLLISSVRSFFTQRSINAQRKQSSRSAHTTSTPASFRQPAFIRGLY